MTDDARRSQASNATTIGLSLARLEALVDAGVIHPNPANWAKNEKRFGPKFGRKPTIALVLADTGEWHLSSFSKDDAGKVNAELWLTDGRIVTGTGDRAEEAALAALQAGWKARAGG